MRTLLTPAARARREETAALVRHRVDTLFGPQQPLPSVSPPIDQPSLAQPSLGPATSDPPHSPSPPHSPTSPHAPTSPRVRLSFGLALKERWDLDRRAVIGLAVLLVLALGYGVQHFWAGRPEPVAVPAPAVEGAAVAVAPTSTSSPAAGAPVPPAQPGPPGSPAPSTTAIAELVVDVSGKVRAPGLRTLPPGSRVQDAINAAGGPLPGTDLTGLNLARKVNDGEEIIVGPGAPAGQGGPGASRASGPLSLNAATGAQLDALPGVGPVLAGRIIQFREQHGGFQSVDQLRQVPGFGERRLEDLRSQLRP
ncbi:helix-hairpin-helix domain-containing protein [Streptacidiphilus sp. MAP5-3]|uniref:helix-hairpin-helix domain-containing protein n=1 Tax=unclassified Streptacidiphilus TaxID=2643834 RepID=UPI0035184225